MQPAEEKTETRRSGRSAVGHPVDVASGNLFDDFVDHALSGQLPISFDRRYSGNLVGNSEGMFGSGWSSPFEMRLIEDLDGFRLLDADGESEVEFDDPDNAIHNGTIIRNYEAFLEICLVGDQYKVLRWNADSADIQIYLFKKATAGVWMPLNAIGDIEGRRVEITRDADGRIQRLKQLREKRGYLLGYNDHGQLEKVRTTYTIVRVDQDTNERTYEERDKVVLDYTYDESGRLHTMRDAMGHTCSYIYDNQNRLVEENNIGGMVYCFEYDDKGRCIQAGGINYFNLNKLTFDDSGRVTWVTNTEDEQTTYIYNEHGQVEQQVDPLGAERKTEYDDYGRIVKEIDPLGGATEYEYDDRGNRCKVTTPGGAVTEYQHNDQHQVTAVVDPERHIWQREIDDTGRIRGVINPLNARVSFEYSKEADLTSITDPKGAVTRYQWDEFANLTAVVDPVGNATHYKYDWLGWLVTVIDAKGCRTRAQLDELGRLQTVTLADGARRSYEWNPYGQITKFTDELGYSTVWNYQACGIPLEVVRAHGGRVKFEWSLEPGQLTKVVNERGEEYLFEYNAAGHVTREVDFAGRVTQYELDPTGQSERIIDNAGGTTSFSRDLDGQVTEITYPDNAITTFAYSARGQLLAADNGQVPVTRKYDSVGRMIEERQGVHTITNTYDEAGYRVKRESNLGLPTDFEWGLTGQIKSITTEGHNPIQFEYDERLNEVSRRIGPTNITHDYDDRGRPVEQKANSASSGKVAVGGDAVVARKYQYDAASNLTRVLDANWGTSQYIYDAVGRITTAEIADRLKEIFEYDANDNITRTTTTGTQATALSGKTVERRTYTSGNTLERKGDTQFKFDQLGQLKTRIDEKGEFKFEWNGAGQLTAILLPDENEVVFEYDAFSRRTKKVSGDKASQFAWDGDVVLLEEKPQEGNSSAQWEFDPHSFAPLCKTDETGTLLTINDLNGAPSQMVSESGQLVWKKEASLWGERAATHDKQISECPVSFQGQWLDEETGFTYNRFRYYDSSSGKYISEDPIGLLGGLNGSACVKNTTGWIDPFGLNANKPCDFVTNKDEAVFWSGIGRGGDKKALSWVRKNGGASLESTMADRGLSLPTWDATNPNVTKAWRNASRYFAEGAKGDVKVLQGDAMRMKSVWAEVEFPALKKNKNVTSITAVNPDTGESFLLWKR